MNTKFRSSINDARDHKIPFTTSSIEEDIGQTTVLLLDIQPVKPLPHVPLSRIGLYHKSHLPIFGN